MSGTRNARSAQVGRDFNASSFANSVYGPEEDLDPMSGVANIVDAILVFACGLILALIVHWNVDISANMDQVTPTGEMEQVQDAQEAVESKENGGKGYEELGRAYRDPETGQYYIMVEE